MIASAAWWFNARGLGSIYIWSRKFLKKWNKTLEFGCIFLFEKFISYIKIMLMLLPALAMGLGGICIIDTVFEKNMVSLDVYIDIIMPLKFLISYINIMIL